jgi:hypothetical protein
MNGQLDIYLGEGYTVVVLSNLDPPAGVKRRNLATGSIAASATRTATV